MKYWVQMKAPAGNWYDSIGLNDKEQAISYAKGYMANKEVTRVVERVDTQVFPQEDA